VVILGDNVFGSSLKKYIDNFRKQKEGARILVKRVSEPQRFGVVEVKGRKIVSIKEKPRKPASNYIVTGIYMYDRRVFEFIKKLKLSRRGEYEITDINNMYLKQGLLSYDILQGFWTDCGTFNSLLKANLLIARKRGINLKKLL
jgi:glucose-1-phosphate thymidylyltransferase